jgi:hypothetical protein
VIQSSGGLADRCNDLGMRVTQDGTHLAGREVEHAAAIGIVEKSALRACWHKPGKVGAIAQHVTLGARPERIIRFDPGQAHVPPTAH